MNDMREKARYTGVAEAASVTFVAMTTRIQYANG